MAEIWGAAIAVAGAVGGAAMQADAAKDAAAASGKGADASIAEQRRQYDTTRRDTAPYRAIGTQAINALGSIYGYRPAATPLSFDEWAKANPNAGFVAPGATGGGTSTRDALIEGTDPLGLYSGDGFSVERALDPLGLFGGSKKPKPKDVNAVRDAEYQRYLQRFDYNAPAPTAGNALAKPAPSYGSSPKTPPQGYDPSSGYMVTGSGGVRQGVTIDNDTGQVVDGVQPGYGGATAAGPPMMAGPDYSNFFMSPDYQFRRQQGTQGIERTASARGLTGSGNALAALTEYNSNLAAGEFGNYFNRQAALAGIGQAATNTSTTAGMNSANNISGALQDAANARASGISDQSNAWGNALGTIGGIAYDRWGRPKKTGGP